MQQHEAAIRSLGGEVLAVCRTRPEQAAAYLTRHPLPFPLLTDPEGEAYRGLALGRTSWATMVRAGVLGRYLKLLFRGWRPQKPVEGEDLLQLGGDFVLDGARRLVYAFRSPEPTARPAVADLVEAVRTAVGEARPCGKT